MQITIGFMVLVALFFALLIHEAIGRWKRLEKEGRLPDPGADEEVAS